MESVGEENGTRQDTVNVKQIKFSYHYTSTAYKKKDVGVNVDDRPDECHGTFNLKPCRPFLDSLAFAVEGEKNKKILVQDTLLPF